MVKKPKILIMDDCLSALDTETEEKIIKSLNEFIKDTTTIISSHRISSIQNLDKIIVLNDGKMTSENASKYIHYVSKPDGKISYYKFSSIDPSP